MIYYLKLSDLQCGETIFVSLDDAVTFWADFNIKFEIFGGFVFHSNYHIYCNDLTKLEQLVVLFFEAGYELKFDYRSTLDNKNIFKDLIKLLNELIGDSNGHLRTL